MVRSGAPVLLVEDRDSLRQVLRATLEGAGYGVVEAATGDDALAAVARERLLAVVTDLKLPGPSGHDVLAAAREADPDVPVLLMTAFGTVEDAVRAMKAGAFDFLTKPVDPDHLLLALSRAVERRALLRENLLLREEAADRVGFPHIVGDSEPMRALSRQIAKVAPSDATVLLLGESGTGKELFARALHHMGPRRDGPFVAVNCAAIPDTLLENELFGHEKGAYTGADRARGGRFEIADGGTLFLDEIGELGSAVQAKLLRALQEHAFERVGGSRTIRVDVRVVAATNRDLREAVHRKTFREDLYFRLAVVALTVPALRERPADVAALAAHFLKRFAAEAGRPELTFSDAALEALGAHRWPGNVRELENAVERATILAEGDRIEPDHLGLDRDGAGDPDREAFARAVDLEGPLDEVSERARATAERIVIERALRAAGGNKTRAAEHLEVNYKRLLARIRELDLDGS